MLVQQVVPVLRGILRTSNDHQNGIDAANKTSKANLTARQW